MRSLSLVASLAALFVIADSMSAFAASSGQRTRVSYSSQASASAPQMSRAQAEQPVPPNCIRQECGKLWCWQMGNSKSH